MQTKCDLPHTHYLGNATQVSSITGDGIDRLRHDIFDRLIVHSAFSGQMVRATANRCYESLCRAQADLNTALATLGSENGVEEIMASLIRSGLDELAAVTGKVYTDDLLDRIFKQFCIGK